MQMQWLPLGLLQGMGGRAGDSAMHACAPPPPAGNGTHLDFNFYHAVALLEMVTFAW